MPFNCYSVVSIFRVALKKKRDPAYESLAKHFFVIYSFFALNHLT